jgi:hypothetical protein
MKKSKLFKKVILGLFTLVLVISGAAAFSAFEAHVINVTATIENTLTVPVEQGGLNFGDVFPEQVLHKTLGIALSSSFLNTPRVDDVEYMIRQKPKCGIPVPASNPVSYSGFPQVTEDQNGKFVCPQGSVELPLLCPYLSKHELDARGNPTGNGIDAFHGPITEWTMADTTQFQVTGQLSKADNKSSTSWDIDLHSPCFKDNCAQDNVVPANYQPDISLEHSVFGCDLWLEVTNISLPPPPTEKAHLTVVKIVHNNHGGNDTVGSFTLLVDDGGGSVAVSSSISHDFVPGTYDVTEQGNHGYSASFSGDCNNEGHIVLAANDNKVCTITNTDLEAHISLVKNVVGGTALATSFKLRLDGVLVPTGSSNAVTSNSAHVINEDAKAGYHFTSITGDPKCPAALLGTATLNEGEDITCTVTNTAD